MSSDDEDENKKDWDKEKDPPGNKKKPDEKITQDEDEDDDIDDGLTKERRSQEKRDLDKQKNLSDSKKKPDKKKTQDNDAKSDDGLSKERLSQQLIDGVSQLSQEMIPTDTLPQNDPPQIRDGEINRLELNNLQQRLAQTERRNRIMSLELDKANLETRRMKLQLENLKATSQLKLERAELETDKVRFQGQKETAETLIEMLKVKQELQQVKRENQVKNVEINKLKTEIHTLKMQTNRTSENLLEGGDNMASYMSSGLQFLAMQQNTRLLQGRMVHTQTRNNTAPTNRSPGHFGEGYYVCGQCMEAEFPNSLEGQRMLETHLETEHPQRGAHSEAPSCDQEEGDVGPSRAASNHNGNI